MLLRIKTVCFNLYLFCLLVTFFIPNESFADDASPQGSETPKENDISEKLKKSDELKALGDYKEASRLLNEVATIYWEAKNYDSAIGYYEKSLALNTPINNRQGMLGIYGNLAMIYADKKSYSKSLEYFLLNLEGRREGKDKVSLISSLINVSVVLNNLKRWQESATYLEEALDHAREMNDADQMKSCYGMLSETYEKANNSEKSIHYFNLYKTFHEMVSRDKEIKYKETAQAAELKSQLLKAENENHELALQFHELEIYKQKIELDNKEKELTEFDSANQLLLKSATKKQLLIEILNKNNQINKIELQRKQTELAKEQLTRNVFIGLAAILVAFAGYLFWTTQMRKKTNIKLQKQNEEILGQKHQIEQQSAYLAEAHDEIVEKNVSINQSINYAQRIQLAMLASSQHIQQSLPDSFLLFKPRNVVSGDFYWFKQIDGKLLVAATDCTGHGVPGAFMSMIGINILNQITSQGIVAPDQILNGLHEGVVKALSQGHTSNQDGMDIALFSVDEKNGLLEFSGAHNPMIYIKDGEMGYLKAEKLSVGGKRISDKGQTTSFGKQSLYFEKDLYVYIFSDGYQDQFGGPENKKFMIKKLRTMIFDIYMLPAHEQKDILEKELAQWMAGYNQTDDILLIGAKFQKQNT